VTNQERARRLLREAREVVEEARVITSPNLTIRRSQEVAELVS